MNIDAKILRLIIVYLICNIYIYIYIYLKLATLSLEDQLMLIIA